jgi:hypothetical protein
MDGQIFMRWIGAFNKNKDSSLLSKIRKLGCCLTTIIPTCCLKELHNVSGKLMDSS